MAQFDASVVVNVVTKGEQRLNQIKASVNEINRLSQNLKPINLLSPGGGKLGDSVRAALKPIKDFAREAVNGTQRYSSTLSGATGQAQTFKTVLDNVKIAAGGYDKQVADVKNYAAALAGAEKQARELAERQRDLLTDARTRAGITPQGQSTLLGSDEAFQARAAYDSRIIQEKEITKQKNQQAFLDERAARTAERIARIQDQARRKQQQRENLRLGVGFPLLFGGGPGSVAGGALGALSDSGGGFGGQVLFSAIGAQIDEAVKRAREFGDAIQNIDVDALEDALGNVSSELKLQIQLLKERGELSKAQAQIELEVARQTGLAGGASQNIANAVGILESGFKEVLNAATGLIGIIGAPFAAALGAVLSLFGKAIALLNTILSGVGKVLERLTRWAIEITFGKEAADRLDQAIKNLNKSLDTSIDKVFNLGRELRESATDLEAVNVLRSTRDPFDDLTAKIRNLRIEAGEEFRKIQKEYEDSIKDINQLPENTTEQRVLKETAKLEADKVRRAKELKVQTEFTQKIDKLRADDLKKQTRELEKQAALRRKITDAQLSAQLAKDIFAAQPLPDPTPFSRATPEQTRGQAVEEQALRYANEKARIENQNLSVLEREAKLREAAAKNDLAALNINKQYTETVKQRTETRIRSFEGLDLQLKKLNAVSDREREILQIGSEVEQLRRDGIILTDEQAEAYRKLKLEVYDTANGFEAQMKSLVNTVGVSLKNAMETALVDTIGAALTGADDLNDKLKQTAATLLSTIGKALVGAGIQGLAGNDGQGFFSILSARD